MNLAISQELPIWRSVPLMDGVFAEIREISVCWTDISCLHLSYLFVFCLLKKVSFSYLFVTPFLKLVMSGAASIYTAAS